MIVENVQRFLCFKKECTFLFKMKIFSKKMSKCVVVIVFAGLVLSVSAVTGNGSNENVSNSARVYSRSIPNLSRDRVGGGRVLGLGNPSEWTMSKANLVAEFFTSEPAPSRERIDRSQKSIFSYLTGVLNNGSTEKAAYLPAAAAAAPPPQRMAPPPPPPLPYDNRDKSVNLIASETNYNHHSLPFDITRNNVNIPPGGYATPFRPIAHPPQQNFIFPSGISGSPGSGYPQNVRPPRGPPIQPPRQFVWDSRPINGLRPPPVGQNQQQQNQRPSSLYLPPNQPPLQSPRPLQPPSQGPAVQIPRPPPPQNLPQTQTQPQYSEYSAPAPNNQINNNNNNNSAFTPSTQYQFSEQQKPDQNISPGVTQSFQPGSPPPKILDTYSKQAVYPPPPPPGQYSTDKPLVYVMANSSFDQPSNAEPSKSQFGTNNPLTSYTQYENEPVPPPPVPGSVSLHKTQQSTLQVDQYQHQQPGQSAPPTQQQQLNLNALALTEPLSHVLAEANAKAGEAMDKTIRFVIHKPEDEDVVKNAILEDAQNRYEDVKFVQGPTLKVQRKETVYLPPKKKTVVYILLKEPQIDTDVQVMSPQEDEAAPEVYITYQKSDGAVKTKHYSPKPIREEDMKKYLDIEEDSFASGEESRFHPRFSKSTSVSLSTSSKVSRKTATMSTSSSKLENNNRTNENNDSLLANHNLSPPSTSSANETARLSDMKTSPLLYTSRNADQIQISNSTSSVRLPQKKPRSSEAAPVVPLPRRRILRHNPIQCPTGT